MTLSVRIPDFRAANTRAVDEKGIAEITVLMFADEGGTEKVKVKYDIPGSSLRTPSGSSDTRTFSVPVTAGTYKRIALITNAQTELASIAAGSTYDALKQVEVTGRFGQAGTGTYIPMYGEHAPAGGFELKAGVSQTIAQEIPLIRMLARVDIINSITSGATTAAGKVYFVNPVGNGRVWVDLATYNTTSTQSGYMTPTLPVAPQPAVGGGHPLEGIANTTSPNVITYYLNEQLATAGGSRPCIVMFLNYQGREYYYRMDYTWDGIKGGGAPPYEKGKYMPILRNHRYIFTIKEVKGPGFDTMQEAITSPENFTNHNIVVTPIVIDEAFADIAFNESGHFLAVTRTEMRLPLNQTIASTDNKFDLRTNYPPGWKISCVEADGSTAIPNTGWLQVNISNGSAGAKSTVSVLTQGVGDKEGLLVVRAGRLITHIRINQKDFCGWNGTAKPLRIGNNDYLTHRYGTKCWMVQNSKEGNPETGYPGENPIRAYYSYEYSNAVSRNPCPVGWHIPTFTEGEQMVMLVKDKPNGIGKFWWGPEGAANNAFEGWIYFYRNYLGESGTSGLNGFGTHGHWIIEPLPGSPGATIQSDSSNITCSGLSLQRTVYMSVRCVRDSDY
ncbi:hypothetical protein F070042J6_39010 [Bacteroides sp. f07]